jgi:hypothetical protein
MKTKPVIDVEKALSEKEQMQKIFVREHGYPSPVSALVIKYFKERKGKN